MRRQYWGSRTMHGSMITVAIVALIMLGLLITTGGFGFHGSAFGYGYGYGGGGGGYIPSPNPTPTPTPTPTPSATPEATPAEVPSPEPGGVVEDLTGIVSANGELTERVTVTSENSNAVLRIPAGTVALDGAGEPLGWITCQPVVDPPPPPAGIDIIVAVDFGPDGATFDPPIDLSLIFDRGALSSADTDNLTMAYYDTSAGQWVELGNVVFQSRRVSAQVSHFTQFAVLEQEETQAEPASTAEPEPAPTAEPEPVVEPEPTQEPEPISDDFEPLASSSEEETGGSSGNPWTIIVPILAILVVGGIGFFVLRRRSNWS